MNVNNFRIICVVKYKEAIVKVKFEFNGFLELETFFVDSSNISFEPTSTQNEIVREQAWNNRLTNWSKSNKLFSGNLHLNDEVHSKIHTAFSEKCILNYYCYCITRVALPIFGRFLSWVINLKDLSRVLKWFLEYRTHYIRIIV